MPNDRTPQAQSSAENESRAWQKPGYELIALDCEITAYAPDGDPPLF
jgi:hypothetical protein